MTSLVLSRFAPSSTSGGAALRNRQNIRALSRLGPVDVAAIGVAEGARLEEDVRVTASFAVPQPSAWERAWARSWPLRGGAFPAVEQAHRPEVSRWIAWRAAAGGYDVAVVEGITLAGYVPELKQVARRVIYDAHNVESTLCADTMSSSASRAPSLTQRLRRGCVQRRLAQVEARTVAGADLVWACSDLDAAVLERVFRPASVAVVPNGVDVAAYRRTATPIVPADWSEVPVTLVYPGLFSYAPNEDAAMRLILDVLPALRARHHPVRAVLVGREPTARMLDAARRDAGVVVTGAVDHIVPYLQQPCVVTLPIAVGGGTRLKILEAFAAGSPVVSTAKGAEGLAAVDGQHLLIREDATAIAAAVVQLWSDSLLRSRLCRNALDLVNARYSWAAAGDAIAASLGVASPPAAMAMVM